MFCPKCGKELPKRSKFCPDCGAGLRRPQPEPGWARKSAGRSLKVLCWFLVLCLMAEGLCIGWLITKMDRPLYLAASLIETVSTEATEPAETGETTAPTEPGPPAVLWENPRVGEQVARKLGLPVEEVTRKHTDGITDLKLDFAPGDSLEDLALLPKLTSLALQCSGELDLEQMYLPEGLRILVLRGRTVGSLEKLGTLTGLEELSLSLAANTQVDLAPLEKLEKLKLLDLGNLKCQTWKPLEALTGLRTLTVTNSNLKNLAPLSHLSELKRLYITGCEVWDLNPLSGLEKLRKLYLTSLPLEDLWPIAGLTELESLGLWNCRITKVDALRDLEELEDLNLMGNEIRDLSPLMDLPVWEHRAVRYTGIPDDEGHVAFE